MAGVTGWHLLILIAVLVLLLGAKRLPEMTRALAHSGSPRGFYNARSKIPPLPNKSTPHTDSPASKSTPHKLFASSLCSHRR
jgi:hypothetical protein